MTPEVTERVVWSPGANFAQWALIQSDVFEIFFGGARGGGKSDGVLGEWMNHADRYGINASGLMLRRTRTELMDTIERSRAIYGPLRWTYHEQEKTWRDPRGARLKFGYLERDADAELYQGHSYTRVYIEEAGNFPSPVPVMKLMATLRSGADVPVGMRLTGNPGGPGHQWIRARYIDYAPLGNRIIRDPGSGLERLFIPSKVDNNVHIDAEAYKKRLRASGSPELVRAWLAGDWTVTLGAFFDCFSTARHVIPPFEIPPEWMRFRSMDWGSAAPLCVQWWSVVSDDYSVHGRVLPRGCLVLYREWYGMQPGQPNVGLKLHAEVVGKEILQREKGEDIAYGVLDPSAFAEDGGPSIAERMGTGSDGKIWFKRADNKRVNPRQGGGAMGGWDAMRGRLVGNEDGHPMLVVFSTAVDFIRTVPFLQHDPDRHEDVMTDAEDHSADCSRYACMSRPWVTPKEPPSQANITGYSPVKPQGEQAGDWRTYVILAGSCLIGLERLLPTIL